MRISILIAALSLVFSGCATIIGGRHYRANIVVDDHRAQIVYNGMHVGYGSANVRVPRRNANDFVVIIKQDLCETQEFRFTQRRFRGWAFLGTVVGWTGVIINDEADIIIPLPWGVVVDGITGALWKPDHTEIGVYKINYNNYNYLINYTGCATPVSEDQDP